MARHGAIRLCLLGALLMALLRADGATAMSLAQSALKRGPEPLRTLSRYLEQHRASPLANLVEFITRTRLLPGSELALLRAAALASRAPSSNSIDAVVASILTPRPRHDRAEPAWPNYASKGGTRFIVERSSANPYYGAMYSQLDRAGFDVHWVSSFEKLLDALDDAQRGGESPHVHLDHWLTHNRVRPLLSRLHDRSSLSVSIHDLPQKSSRQESTADTDAILRRADAIHLLTQSSLQHLTLDPRHVEGRLFHVPHPSYLGEHAGDYQLPRDRREARARLGRPLDEFAVGLVGRISDRKNVELLLSAGEILSQGFQELPSQPHIYISGSLRTRSAEEIVRRAHGSSNITVIANDLDDAEVGLHVAALDVGVVPYHPYLNSGWTLLALSAGLPIIASRESTADEVVPREALFTFAEGDARSLADAIARSMRCNGEVAQAAALARARDVHPDVIGLRFAQEIAARVTRRHATLH